MSPDNPKLIPPQEIADFTANKLGLDGNLKKFLNLKIIDATSEPDSLRDKEIEVLRETIGFNTADVIRRLTNYELFSPLVKSSLGKPLDIKDLEAKFDEEGVEAFNSHLDNARKQDEDARTSDYWKD